MLITKGIDRDCFEEMLAGQKFYELRLGDFLGRSGDLLVLEEKDPIGTFTGRRLAYGITYVSSFRLDELPWPRADVDRLGIALMSIETSAYGRNLPSVSKAEVPLKTWPAYFSEVIAGRKRYEFRLGDRLCQPGKILRLREFDPGIDAVAPGSGYTGREALARVTQSRRWSLTELSRFWPIAQIEAKGLCAISLEPIDPA